MQVKRFVAANMRMALKMVREEMGPDAIILSNKRVSKGVELLISVEPDALEDVVSQPSSPAASINPFEQAVLDSEKAVGAKVNNPLSETIDREQQIARLRAENLNRLLASKNKQQLEQLVDTSHLTSQEDIPRATKETIAEDKVDFSASLQSQLKKSSVPEVENYQLDPQAANNVTQSDQAILSLVNQDKQLSEMRYELQSMRDLIEQQFHSMSWANYNKQSPVQASFWKRLKRMGIGSNVLKSMLEKYDFEKTGNKGGVSDTWQQLMVDLCQRLPVAQSDLIEKGGVFAFVGPTGAGKTTTIGKLAARYVLQYGSEDIALVTTDTMRIAAHEQLRTFGRILNIPVSIVDKNNSLERVMHSLRHKSVVLIDTAGLTSQDDRLSKQLNSLNEAGSRIKTLLVMPATSQLEVIRSVFHSYKTDNLSGCVITKMDETTSLGEVMTLSIDKSLPIAYTTDGQGIPNDIAVADSSNIVRSAIYLAKSTSFDEHSMAEEFNSSSH